VGGIIGFGSGIGVKLVQDYITRLILSISEQTMQFLTNPFDRDNFNPFEPDTEFWFSTKIRVENRGKTLIHSMSHFVFLNQAADPNQWLAAFQRSLADFLPVRSLPGDIKVGIIDYAVKVVGGALTFVLLAVALRRKFERKYTR
jgi:hypothetical protein